MNEINFSPLIYSSMKIYEKLISIDIPHLINPQTDFVHFLPFSKFPIKFNHLIYNVISIDRFFK